MYLFLNSIQISKKNVKPRCGGDQATKFAQRENSVVHSSQKSAATLFRRAFLALCTTEFCLCANFVALATMHRVSHRSINFFCIELYCRCKKEECPSCLAENTIIIFTVFVFTVAFYLIVWCFGRISGFYDIGIF